jgi:hypothetical protein
VKSIRFFLVVFLICAGLPLLPSVSWAVHEEDIEALQHRLETVEQALKEKKEGLTVDFNGWLRARYHVSNFSNFTAGQSLPGDESVPDGNETANFAEERTLLFISPHFGENVAAQFGFTTDFMFGDEAFGVSGVGGGGLKAREVNVKTLAANLLFTVPGTNLTAKVGLQNIKDAYNGILLGWPDGSGVNLDYKASDRLKLKASWYRFWQPTGRLKANVPVDFWRGEAAYAANENLDLGFNLYYLSDKSGEDATAADPGVLGGAPIGTTHNGFAPLAYNASTGHESLVGDNQYKMYIVWPGVDFNYRINGYTIDGFLIYEGGKFTAISPGIEDVTLSSFAGNLGVATDVGATHVKLSGIYVAGDDSDKNPSIGIKKKGFYTPGSYSLSGAWMGLTGMKILFPDLDATAQDQALVYDVSNIFEQKPLGVKSLLLTSNTNLTDKVNLEAGIGTLFSDKKRSVNGKSHMGTEINAGIHYRIYKNVSVGLQTAYAWIGDFYKVTDAQAAAYNATTTGNPISALNDPADAWLVYFRSQLSF